VDGDADDSSTTASVEDPRRAQFAQHRTVAKATNRLTQSRIDLNRYASEPLDISGYLHKRGDRGAIRQYKRRFFRLYQGERLFYYKDQRDEGKLPLGSISLHYVLSVEGKSVTTQCMADGPRMGDIEMRACGCTSR
jgi:hypothetical protein